MVLQLQPSAAAQAELDALVDAQHDPASPLFHQWLTPSEFGGRFGATAADVAKVTAWLRGHGFTVDEISPSNRLMIFSGTAADVVEAFHTEIHSYRVNGVDHMANVEDPQIPRALAGVVSGVLSLHDFRRSSEISAKRPLAPQVGKASGEVRPEYTSGSSHYLFPADWATIYDLNSVYGAGKTGSGASIAIVGRSNINASDVMQFRSASGLPANPPKVIFVSANPGLVSGDQDESTLDVEWSGAIAPEATVNFVVGASTATTDGVDLSAQYIVNHATAQVVSTSYGSCEQDMGASEMAFYNGLWEQAASEGISAFVSSGDSGAAGCDGGSSTTGTMAAVNGLCSSPYSTCVGGTEFNEGSNPAEYWSATSNASNYESALGYIPEAVWNESALNGGSGLWASTGGASVVYQQPSWQKGVSGASAANGMRTVPDVAMTAAGHDGYAIVENGSFWIIAGTSAASPSFAGVMALVVQSQGGKGQGTANPALYGLLSAAKNPFHPTPSGNNNVPGVPGFTASGAAYNLATGLGSVDGAVLLSSWAAGGGATTGANFAMTQSAKSGTAQTGNKVTFTVGVTESGTAKNAVSLTAQAAAGVTATISPASITPGTSATVTVTVGSTATAGAQNVTITGSNSFGRQTVTYALTVTVPPSLTVTAASSTASVAPGASAAVNLTAATGGSFSGNITWSVSGLPSGVSAAWSANPLMPALGSNPETLKLTAASTAKVQSAALTVTATGDGLTATSKVTVQVIQSAGFTLAASPVSVSMQSLGTAAVTVTATPMGGAAVASNAAGSSIGIASGLPKGFTAAWGKPSLTSAGTVAWTLTLTGSASAVAGSSTLGLNAQIMSVTGQAFTATSTVPITVTLTPPTLSLTPASASLAVGQGKSVTDVVTLAGNGTLSGAVTLSVSGLPSGVTATWSSSPLTLSAGSAKSTLTLTASAPAKLGSATVTVTATGDGVSAASKVTLQVTQGAALQLALSATSLSMARAGTASVTVSMTELGGLNVPTTLTLSGLPNGVTPALSKVNSGAAGSESGVLTFTGSSKAAVGTSTLTVGVSGISNGVTYSATEALTLSLR